jgi:hypothetical protein
MKPFKKNLKKLKKSYHKTKINDLEDFTFMNIHMDTALAGTILQTIKAFKKNKINEGPIF